MVTVVQSFRLFVSVCRVCRVLKPFGVGVSRVVVSVKFVLGSKHNADIEQKLLEKSFTEGMLEEKEGEKSMSEIALSDHEQNCRQAKENAEICDATKKRAIDVGAISTIATIGVGALFAPFTGKSQ